MRAHTDVFSPVVNSSSTVHHGTVQFGRDGVIFNKSKRCAVGLQELLIGRYEHKLDHSHFEEILPIGVIKCAAAKASPMENLPWVTFSSSERLKRDNWCNVLAQHSELIKARGIGDQITADVHSSSNIPKFVFPFFVFLFSF